ncbi:MAG: hypothetical protein IKV53_07260 [Clostridia bacterium]|nr:hypothetical protein [Clostridia bacterium]
MPNIAWKTDNYKFVGKAFDFHYANRMNKLSVIMGTRTSNSIDYELTGSGGYGEMQLYENDTLNKGTMKRGFKTIITPQEYSNTIDIGLKQAKVDKSGECRKVGTRLAESAAMTVYMHGIRCFGNAFDNEHLGGDEKAWAAADHPIASIRSEGRKFIADPDAGTYSNLITDSLSVSAITKAQTMANRFVTPDGMPFLCDMDTLLVSPELEAMAKKICGDDARLDPESSNHSANPVYGMKYIVLGGGNDGFSAKQWAVCDRRLMKELFNIVYITKPTVYQTELDNPLLDRYTGYADFGVGWGDARQIIFSNPA